MSCDLTGGLSIGCRTSMGGVVEVYLQQFDKFATGSTAFATNSSNVITGVTFVSSAYTGFYRFQFEPETAQWSDNGTSSANGNFVDQTLALQFAKAETAKRNQVRLLTQKPVVAIVKDGNGTYWALGTNSGLWATTYTAGSGKAAGDLNGYTLNFAGKSPELAYEISSTAFSFV